MIHLIQGILAWSAIGACRTAILVFVFYFVDLVSAVLVGMVEGVQTLMGSTCRHKFLHQVAQ